MTITTMKAEKSGSSADRIHEDTVRSVLICLNLNLQLYYCKRIQLLAWAV